MKEIFAPDATLLKLLPKAAPKAGITYVPSQFSVSFAHRGKQYAFNTLTKQCLETALPKQTKAGEGFDPLIEARFLVPEGKDECAFYESVSSMMRTAMRRKGTRGYVILPTLRCNARCVYCYEAGRVQEKMTPETVEATLRYILDHHGSEQVKLNWFGGEPLLCTDIIDRISSGLKEAGVSFTASIVSNGSLITPAIIEKMLGPWHIKRAQISMDGAEPDYIARKNYRSGVDPYHSVLKSISRLSEAGITVSLRINSDEGNWADMPQFIDDMKRYIENKDRVLVYFAALNDVRTGENDLAFWKKLSDGRSLITDAGFNVLSYIEPPMQFRVNRCMADGGGVVIGPDGSLYPCEHCPPESRYGDVFRDVTDETVQREFRRADRTREKCRNCPILPGCTSFANCPIVDTHCREARELFLIASLKRRIDRNEAQMKDTDEEDLDC